MTYKPGRRRKKIVQGTVSKLDLAVRVTREAIIDLLREEDYCHAQSLARALETLLGVRKYLNRPITTVTSSGGGLIATDKGEVMKRKVMYASRHRGQVSWFLWKTRKDATKGRHDTDYDKGLVELGGVCALKDYVPFRISTRKIYEITFKEV